MSLTVPYSPHTPSRVRLDDGSERDVPARMTLDEFRAFPWPEKETWELIWEVPVLAARPRPVHQLLIRVLCRFIEDALVGRTDLLILPEVDVMLSPARSWIVPDIVVSRETDVNLLSRPIEYTPLLAVEIASPSTESIDVGPKRDAYAEALTPEYWTVDPEICSVSVHVQPKKGEYQKMTADEDGFVTSPLLGCSFRISRAGSQFRVVTR